LTTNGPHNLDEYLTTEELCARIKFKKQSIYNKIYKGELVEGTHFLKPSPRKLLFRWSAMMAWLGDKQPGSAGTHDTSTSRGDHPGRSAKPERRILRSAINI